jgi:hypothetical protein
MGWRVVKVVSMLLIIGYIHVLFEIKINEKRERKKHAIQGWGIH